MSWQDQGSRLELSSLVCTENDMRHMLASLAFAVSALLPTAVMAQDASAWGGVYGGAQLSYNKGYFDWGGGDDREASGSSYGVFAGYLWTRGGWAYGVEISYAKARVYGFVGDGPKIKGQLFTRTADIKARLGYAMDRTLVYGVLGYGVGTWEEYAFASVYNNRGPVYGLGFDYLVSDHLTLGAEVLWRDLDNPELDLVNDPFLDTASLRLSYRF